MTKKTHRSGVHRQYYIEQFVQNEAVKMVSSGVTVNVNDELRYLGQETQLIQQSTTIPDRTRRPRSYCSLPQVRKGAGDVHQGHEGPLLGNV
jgi:hypothetical protein